MKRFHASLLAVAALSVFALRWQALTDDRLSWDEEYVVTESLGMNPQGPLGAWVPRDVFAPEPALSTALAQLSLTDPYPPLVTTITNLAGHAGNPILVTRLLFVAAGLGLVLLSFRIGQTIQIGPGVLSLAIALSPALTLTNQLVKWVAPSPLLATLASWLLVQGFRGRGVWTWHSYALTVALLLQTHYFNVWILAGHFAVTVVAERRSLKNWLLSSSVAVASMIPWLWFALATQLSYLRDFFTQLGAQSYTPYSQPISIERWLRSSGYVLEVSLGFFPGDALGRGAWMAPFLLLGALGLARAWRNERTRMFTSAAACTWLAGWAGQTLYAVHQGNTVTLSWGYMAPWIPGLTLSMFLGLLSIHRRALRYAAVALALAPAAYQSIERPYHPTIANHGGLGEFKRLAAYLDRAGLDSTSGLLLRNVYDAKILSYWYRGSARFASSGRLTASDHPRIPAPPPNLRTILRLSGEDSACAELPGWSRPMEIAMIGRVRVERLVREARTETDRPQADQHRNGR